MVKRLIFLVFFLLSKNLTCGEILLKTLEGHSSDVDSVSFSPDGRLLASGSDDKTIKIWETNKWALIETLKGHRDYVYSVSFSPDGWFLASGSGDTTIKIWDVSEIIRQYEELEKTKKIILFFALALVSFFIIRKIIIAFTLRNIEKNIENKEKTIKLYKIYRFFCKEKYTDFKPEVLFKIYEYMDKLNEFATLIVKELIVKELIEFKEIKNLKGHSDYVKSLSFLPDGKFLASGSDDKTIKIFTETFPKETFPKEMTEISYKLIKKGYADNLGPEIVYMTYKNMNKLEELVREEFILRYLNYFTNLLIEDSQYSLVYEIIKKNGINNFSLETIYTTYKNLNKLDELVEEDLNPKELAYFFSKLINDKKTDLAFKLIENQGPENFTLKQIFPVYLSLNKYNELLDILKKYGSKFNDYNSFDLNFLKTVKCNEYFFEILKIVVDKIKNEDTNKAFEIYEFIIENYGYKKFDDEMLNDYLTICKKLNKLDKMVMALFNLKKSDLKSEPIKTTQTTVLFENKHEKYEFLTEIGRGGMGIVYEAINKQLNKKVAIKKMREELAINRREKERFIEEARRVAILHHPNIVDIYDIYEEGGNIFLVFEYIEGKTIDKILDERIKLNWKEAVNITLGVCEALNHAHSKGIIHRDIKPSNIMLTKENFVKVMDFGIARQAVDTLSMLTGTMTSGTMAYMPPEQHLGRYDERSDIYSLGVTLYEMITGELPFKGPDFLSQKREMVFKKPSEIVKEIPQELEKVIIDCFSPDMDKRPKSANELKKRLLEV